MTSSYGTCGLTYDASASDFTPYDDITADQAQAWVWGHVSQEDTEAAIAAKIDAIANPTTAAGVPWQFNLNKENQNGREKNTNHYDQ